MQNHPVYTDNDPQNELSTLNLGPTHPATHGVFQNVLQLDGERIVSGVSTIGYIHRAFEKIAEHRPFYQITPLTDRMNYCSSPINNMGWHMGGTVGQLGKTYDDRAARGGPAVRQDMYVSPWLFINGDDRKAVVPSFSANYWESSAKRNWSTSYSPQVDFKAMGRFSSSLSLNWNHNVSDNQWYGNFNDASVRHYTFAHLDQHTTAVTARLNYTFTPNLSLQTYAQPFVSKGTYNNVRQLSATPRADNYDDRYAPYINPSVTANPGGFNFKAFQSNVVLRWEYKPASTLFVVWNQGRQGFAGQEGNNAFQGDVRDLFSMHPANTFLVKMSYWLNR